jgi:hypothetical protein
MPEGPGIFDNSGAGSRRCGRYLFGRQRREVAALFTDVSGFTALAETISPSVLGAGSLTDSRLRLFCFVRLDTGLHLCHMPAPASIGELRNP